MVAQGNGRQPIDYRSIVGMDPGAQWLFGPGFRYFAPAGEENPAIPFILSPIDETAAKAVQALRSRTLTTDKEKPGLILLGPDAPLEKEIKAGNHYSAVARRDFFDVAAQHRQDNVPGPYKEFAESDKRIKLGLPQAGSADAPATSRVKPAATPDPGSNAQPPLRSFLSWLCGLFRRRKNAAAPTPSKRTPVSGATQQSTVVIGIIDDAIAFANARFRRANSDTRFLSFWSQDNISGGVIPVGFTDGNELIEAEINALISGNLHGDWLNEEAVYQSCGTANFTNQYHKGVGWRIAHGTHVADLATGFDMNADRADRRIIGVQLPVAATIGQSGAELEPWVRQAIAYIQDRAAAISLPDGSPAPIIINFSYATHDGPHDGTSALEQYIDGVITKGSSSPSSPPLQIVLPAGNTAQSRCHAELQLKPGQDGDLLMRVQPDCVNMTELLVWLPCQPQHGPITDRVSLSVYGPAGISVGPLLENATPSLPIIFNGATCGLVRYDANAGDRGVFRIDIFPTAQTPDQPGDGNDVLAPSGIWRISLHNVSLPHHEKIQAWITRNDLLYGYPRRGRQAYFDDPTYKRFDVMGWPIDDDPPLFPSVVKRDSMINAVGTGQETIVIGTYRHKEMTLADYSAGGPVSVACGALPDPRSRPDAVFASDDSRVFTGQLAAGTRSGSAVSLSGTSMACARLTRWGADQLATGSFPDRAAVAALATNVPPALPARGGAGRIDFSDPVPPYRTRYWP